MQRTHTIIGIKGLWGNRKSALWTHWRRGCGHGTTAKPKTNLVLLSGINGSIGSSSFQGGTPGNPIEMTALARVIVIVT